MPYSITVTNSSGTLLESFGFYNSKQFSSKIAELSANSLYTLVDKSNKSAKFTKS